MTEIVLPVHPPNLLHAEEGSRHQGNYFLSSLQNMHDRREQHNPFCETVN
jgi:hypothetical protein